MNITLFTKPLSVNEVWKGKRFKTIAYSRYEKQIMALLPDCDVTNVHTLHIEFGFSNKASNIDCSSRELSESQLLAVTFDSSGLRNPTICRS